MTVIFEGNEYDCKCTSPSIPYTLYVSETILLLVPRDVDQIHPSFPKWPAPAGNIQLEISDSTIQEFRDEYERNPKFSVKDVNFVMDHGEVLVAGILQGSNKLMPHWEFDSIFKGDLDNMLEVSSDVKASFERMQGELVSGKFVPSPETKCSASTLCGNVSVEAIQLPSWTFCYLRRACLVTSRARLPCLQAGGGKMLRDSGPGGKTLKYLTRVEKRGQTVFWPGRSIRLNGGIDQDVNKKGRKPGYG
ncbi:hypothetical protein VTL71DRAFT_12934 [Oculimacula yallundae]|uniref:Uncharacterized protein n=1 Tax=Oculimacula yallundae TaxID=86028 RepID=A0ABR4CPD6_9HELO